MDGLSWALFDYGLKKITMICNKKSLIQMAVLKLTEIK